MKRDCSVARKPEMYPPGRPKSVYTYLDQQNLTYN